MLKKKNGCRYVEVHFFDGIYEVVRCCYQIVNSPFFRITDSCEGETYTVTKGYKDHVSEYFDLDVALSIMEETGNMEESDRLWMINQIRMFNKTHLSSIYGKMCREV